MNRGWMNRTMTMVTGMTLVLALVLLAGCGGGNNDVEDDPTAGMGETQVEELPPPPVTEPIAEVPVTPDYATMDPAEYGVDDVFFDFDQYELDNESMGILSANARAMREAGTTILISGHCDERGTLEYNLALGEKRANAVRDYLVSLGVPSSKLRVTSYGENRPFSRGSTEDAWAQNRRAHFERP
jgi:peptidoglycan-associated lipoprotein